MLRSCVKGCGLVARWHLHAARRQSLQPSASLVSFWQSQQQVQQQLRNHSIGTFSIFGDHSISYAFISNVTYTRHASAAMSISANSAADTTATTSSATTATSNSNSNSDSNSAAAATSSTTSDASIPQAHDPIVQHVVVRTDMPGWTAGMLMAQACHASVAALVPYLGRDVDADAYVTEEALGSMTKCVCQVGSEKTLRKLSRKLREQSCAHHLWIEQPEGVPTALATKPMRKSTVPKHLRTLRLFKDVPCPLPTEASTSSREAEAEAKTSIATGAVPFGKDPTATTAIAAACRSHMSSSAAACSDGVEVLPKPAAAGAAATAAKGYKNKDPLCVRELVPVGVARSPYAQKFGIPRQPGLAPAAVTTIELIPPYSHPDSLRGLDGFSHVWISFIFHGVAPRTSSEFNPLVRPPRLGGNSRVGVFASRSTHRPNGMGLSVVEVVEIRPGALVVRGADLLDGTPVVDIKPYIPFVEALPNAKGAWASEPPKLLPVVYTDAARGQLAEAGPESETLITQVLAQDPRPAFHSASASKEGRDYALLLWGLRIVFGVADGVVTVSEVVTNPDADSATGP